MIVADTNLIAYLVIEGERTEAAERALSLDPEWIAPLFWRSELRNVLATQCRHGLLTLEQTVRAMDLAERLMEGHEYALASEIVLRLAADSGCAAYDCEFVALARQREIPLVTSDRELLEAFPATAVSPERFGV